MMLPITPLSPRLPTFRGARRATMHLAGDNQCLGRARLYARRMAFNHIHWPTTARARRLMTKEFELDPSADIWLYLDLQRDTATGMEWSPSAPELNVFGLNTHNNRGEQNRNSTDHDLSMR